MKGNKSRRKSRKKLLWRDLLKRKLEEVNKIPKKQPVSQSRPLAS
ncbi:hypothetical protein ACFO4L_01965 [Bacillus daqingensis]|uniref:Uncharacterized protein n=1 Tax=Bacillus daqingensis TaxID=872396 RepID=A0ABV9NRN4_9BACI